jgi:hypothetical protein
MVFLVVVVVAAPDLALPTFLPRRVWMSISRQSTTSGGWRSLASVELLVLVFGMDNVVLTT